MLMKLGALFASVALAAPQPVTELNTAAYLGRWYQVYASWTVKNTFELGGNCVTADYGETEFDDVISVTNTVRPKIAKYLPRFLRKLLQRVTKITGVAAQSPDTAGALSVSLGPQADDAALADFDAPGNYWIVNLGDINENGQYDWAVVSNDNGNQLYVLVRDVAGFKAKNEEGISTEETVLEYLSENGFTGFFNKPRETNQEGCNYD